MYFHNELCLNVLCRYALYLFVLQSRSGAHSANIAINLAVEAVAQQLPENLKCSSQPFYQNASFFNRKFLGDSLEELGYLVNYISLYDWDGLNLSGASKKFKKQIKEQLDPLFEGLKKIDSLYSLGIKMRKFKTLKEPISKLVEHWLHEINCIHELGPYWDYIRIEQISKVCHEISSLIASFLSAKKMDNNIDAIKQEIAKLKASISSIAFLSRRSRMTYSFLIEACGFLPLLFLLIPSLHTTFSRAILVGVTLIALVLLPMVIIKIFWANLKSDSYVANIVKLLQQEALTQSSDKKPMPADNLEKLEDNVSVLDGLDIIDKTVGKNNICQTMINKLGY